MHNDLPPVYQMLTLKAEDYECLSELVDQLILEYQNGQKNRLDVIIMWCSHLLVRGNQETALLQAEQLIDAIAKDLRRNKLFSHDGLVKPNFAILRRGDALTWRLHLMGSIFQFLSVFAAVAV